MYFVIKKIFFLKIQIFFLHTQIDDTTMAVGMLYVEF